VRAALLSSLFRTGVGDRVFRDRLEVPGPGIEDHLAAVLGGGPLLAAVHIGPPRANRKPVLQLLDPDGHARGYAKIGIDHLTRRLLAAEAAALGTLASAGLRRVTLPRLVHHGSWGEVDVLVQSALPVEPRRATGAGDRLVRAMVELAGATGVADEPLRDSTYAGGLANRLAVGAGRPGADHLAAALRSATATGVVVPFGCWHGDWSPGNAAVLDDTVLVWDWERFEAGVPLGFDALHHHLQAAVTVRGVPPRRAAEDAVRRAPALLAPFGVPAASAWVVVVLYLVEIGTRYLTDRQAEAGAPLGHVDRWLAPVLRSVVAPA
jgi:hypothetical protein